MNDDTAHESGRVRWSARAGTAAPIWFWLTLIALAVAHGRIDVSGHQLLGFGIWMYVGFLAYGSLTVVFVWGLHRRMPPGRRSTSATVALALFAGGPLLGTFTMGAEPGPPQSWHGWLHFAGLLLLSLSPIVALPLFGAAVWRDPRWRPLGPLSVAWGVGVAVIVFLPESPADSYALWSGPGSMVDLALIGTWQIVASQRLAHLARHPSSARHETTSTAPAENAH